MQLLLKRNHLSGILNLKGRGATHQLKLRSAHRVCPLKVTWRCMPFSVWWATIKVHQRIHSHCTTTQWVTHWGRGLEEVRVGIPYRRSHGGFWSIEAGMYDSSCFGFCWLHQTISVGNMCQKMDLGKCCCRSRKTGGTTPLPMAAWPLHLMRRTITQPNSNF